MLFHGEGPSVDDIVDWLCNPTNNPFDDNDVKYESSETCNESSGLASVKVRIPIHKSADASTSTIPVTILGSCLSKPPGKRFREEKLTVGSKQVDAVDRKRSQEVPALFQVNSGPEGARKRCKTVHCRDEIDEFCPFVKNLSLCSKLHLNKHRADIPYKNKSTVHVGKISTRSSGGAMFRLYQAMEKSKSSQRSIHDWDKNMGLRKSNSKTMPLSSQTRFELTHFL